jgi:hypothetical protein
MGVAECERECPPALSGSVTFERTHQRFGALNECYKHYAALSSH